MIHRTQVPTGVPTSEPTAVPSSTPTMTPTTLPTPVPTLAFARAPFNCSRHNNPIQVMRVGLTYRVVELDFATGTYTLVYELDWLGNSGHTNAVGLVNARIGGVKQNYLLGAFSTSLCFFDGEGKACFDGTLDHSAPNAGVVVESSATVCPGAETMVVSWTVRVRISSGPR